MGIPEQLEQVMKRQLRAHVAWAPISNPFKLGDYGLIANGVFTKMGNTQEEFGISFNQAKGPDASLDFTSDSTSVVNFAGGAQVNVIPEGAVDAKVTFKFNKERSILIKSPTISVSNIENVRAVFNQLKSKEGWQRKFIVVHQTYLAQDAVVMTTIDAGTEITFSGNASALKQLKLADASVQFGSSKKLGLEFKGKTGIIALGLVRMRTNFLEPEIKFLKEEEIETEELNEAELQDDI